jgi:hypothetical protein
MLGMLYPALAWLQQAQARPQTVLFSIAALGAVIYGLLTLLFSKELVHDCKRMLGLSAG